MTPLSLFDGQARTVASSRYPVEPVPAIIFLIRRNLHLGSHENKRESKPRLLYAVIGEEPNILSQPFRGFFCSRRLANLSQPLNRTSNSDLGPHVSPYPFGTKVTMGPYQSSRRDGHLLSVRPDGETQCLGATGRSTLVQSEGLLQGSVIAGKTCLHDSR